MRKPYHAGGQIELFGQADEAGKFARVADARLLTDDGISFVGLADFDEGGGTALSLPTSRRPSAWRASWP